MSANRLRFTELHVLPLWAAVLPLVTINICYAVAVTLDHLPACIPYFSGCTSVSSTGRFAPESWIFRSGMLPFAVIVIFFWWRLAAHPVIVGESHIRRVVVRILGITAALSLLLYTQTLGYPGTEPRAIRRIGINGFAVSNYALLISFVLFYWQANFDGQKRFLRPLMVVCVAFPALAIASEVAKWLGTPRHPANNMAAWNAFILLSVQYALLYRLLRHHQSDSNPTGRAISPRR